MFKNYYFRCSDFDPIKYIWTCYELISWIKHSKAGTCEWILSFLFSFCLFFSAVSVAFLFNTVETFECLEHRGYVPLCIYCHHCHVYSVISRVLLVSFCDRDLEKVFLPILVSNFIFRFDSSRKQSPPYQPSVFFLIVFSLAFFVIFTFPWTSISYTATFVM